MHWFLDLRMRGKLFVSFGLMIVLQALLGMGAYQSIVAVQEMHKAMYEREFAVALNLLTLRSNLNGVRASLLHMMVASRGEDMEAFHRDIKERTQKIDAALKTLHGGTIGPARLDELQSRTDALKEMGNSQLIPWLYEGKSEDAKKLMQGTALDRFREARGLADELGDEAEARAEASVHASAQKADQSVKDLAGVGGVSLLAGLALALFLSNVIANPLNEVAAAGERIVARDLTVAPPIDNRKDEIGTLRRVFRKMVESLRGTLGEIREGASALAAAVGEILATTTQLAAGAAETATAVSETTATVEEVKQTAQV
ncbi:MAG TPA: methyl-accepting chemotaxis protein, partial [Methylococcaceae bacterium]|nr:methyl-accepting chemotaxis protein [Methylococcaceae bacterium]